MSSMDSGSPLLNDYKLTFFAKRFPQTLLGGPKLRLGYEAPFYVYLNQILIFIFPLLLGSVFSGLSESKIVTSMICCYVFACLVTCFVIALNLAVWFKGRRYINISKIQPNVLAEEDEVDFESCCGLETMEFIFTSSKSVLRICVQGLLSGILCGLMFIYLLPANLNRLYSNIAATVVLYLFGWLTVCISQYSLTANPPPEPATFRTQLWIDIAPFMRPFYTVLFGIIGVIAKSQPVLLLTDQVLHAIFPCLILLWILGTLPPLDALFPWLLEQILVFGLGGSPMATDLRLFVMVFISSIPILVAVFIPNYTAAITLCCLCGYILSLDLFGGIFALIKSNTNTSNTLSISSHWSPKEIIISVLMLVLGIVCAAIGTIMCDKVTATMFKGFGVGFCVVLVLLKLLGEFQGVYIFGIVRNPFYPRSMQSGRPFMNRKRQLKHVARLYHLLLTYVCPLVMVSFLGLFLKQTQTTGVLAVLTAFGVVRLLRQVWQNTFLCLLDMCIVCLIGTNWWITTDLAIQLLITALCRDRALQLLQKTSFLLTVVTTSVSLKKQRHKATPTIIILSILFLPVLLAIVISTVVLSSPLLPVFCLPMFLIGFPRPFRSWPQTGDTKTSSGVDAVYYKQLTPKVLTFLTQSLACGTLGWRQAGDHLLLRFQDRMVWVHVVESGYRFSVVVVKGLEMQETSCHTVEAARVDEIFESAFVRDEVYSIFYLNSNFMNTLKPRDVASFNSYSDARNVLTGIIDQPDNLWKVSENFVKTFLWVLIHHCKNSNATDITKKSVSVRNEENHPTNPAKTIVQSRDVGKVNAASEEITSTQTALLQRTGSLPSINGSMWSQESYELETIASNTEKSSSKPVTAKKRSEFESLDSFLNDVITTRNIQPKPQPQPLTPDGFSFGGFPAVDTGAASVGRNDHGSGFVGTSPDTRTTSVSYTEAQNNNTNRNTLIDKPFRSKHSPQLDLPAKWKTNLPHTDKQLKPLLDKFPKSWYEYIINNLKLNEDDSVASDSVLMERYQRLVLNCYAVVEMLGYPGSSSIAAGPVHIYKVFHGDIPWSIHLDWLQKDSLLISIVRKAYRYAFKVMYDEAVLGEITSHEEYAEYLSEYESNWYMGQDTDDDWMTAVINDKPNLFTLGRNKDDGTYTSRILTRQTIRAPVGQLNGEAVRGHWASLALELLYFTNDDEERYSIQAHPVLLRNLTIQAADPPLGYPVYSSGLLSVPVHVAPF